MAIKEAKILSQLDTSHVPTPEPNTELIALVLVEDIFVLEFLYTGAPFLKPSKKMDLLLLLLKRCTVDQTIFEIFA